MLENNLVFDLLAKKEMSRSVMQSNLGGSSNRSIFSRTLGM